MIKRERERERQSGKKVNLIHTLSFFDGFLEY